MLSTNRRCAVEPHLINAVWDNHIAVLVGDFFEAGALSQAVSTGDIRIVDSLTCLGRILSLGELDQIYNARGHTLSEEAYFKIINQKRHRYSCRVSK